MKRHVGVRSQALGRAIGLGALAATLTIAQPQAAFALPKLIIATSSAAVVGSIPVGPEDLLVCQLTSIGVGSTNCNWSLLFDGSTAGLNSAIEAVDMLPDGSLIIRAGSD